MAQRHLLLIAPLFVFLCITLLVGKSMSHPHHDKEDGSFPSYSKMQEVVGAYFKSTGNNTYVPEGDFRLLYTTLNTTKNVTLQGIADYAANLAIHVPISHFRVGAAVLGQSGAVFLGTNIEILGVPLIASVHAEQSATHHCISRGDIPVMLSVNAAPCGYCRQFLSELNNATSFNVVVHPPNGGSSYSNLIEMPLASSSAGPAYLPYFFGPRDLGQTTGMDNSPAWVIKDIEGASELVNETLSGARRSYAPYSLIPAAVGLQFASGRIYVGIYLENAAFNPSLSPVSSALNLAIINGMDVNDLKSVVLVQGKCCPKSPISNPDSPSVDHSGWTHEVIKQIGENIPIEVLVVDTSIPSEE